MDKQELRVELLEQMCECAERITEFYYHRGMGVLVENGFCPEAFKPGVADKAMFNSIIDKCIDRVYVEIQGLGPDQTAGACLMAKYYYPHYGIWREMPIQKRRLKHIRINYS